MLLNKISSPQATLASHTESPAATSSKTYLLVVPTVAPTNSAQSKRQAVGNLISSEKHANQFFHFLEDDQQQKTLKRKVPTTIGPLAGSRFAGRQKEPVNIRPYPTPVPTSPPSSTGSSSSSLSSVSHRLSTGAIIQSGLPQPEIDETDAFDIVKDQRTTQTSVQTNTENSVVTPTSDSLNSDLTNQAKDLVTWAKMDGMESDLVKDFDANLSGLGLELGANAYNMSEVLNLPIFKQESLLVANQGLPPLQYMLCAPTSPATKVYEETLTYLNQGQSYEIKLKKLRDISDIGPLKLVKSQLRVVFHDRRLQYTEYEQFQSWKFNRPGDRLLNIDIPMSVGVIHPREHPDQLNLVEFVWDIDKEASVCVQVRCISTEFTARKHGGEKGVPFRIQIDTYELEASGELGRYIHSASCQIKVFKPKGADRKQKTDKDKMEKRSPQEKLKYQPSYDSTLLSECMPTVGPAQAEAIDERSSNRIMEQISEMVSSEYAVVPHTNNNGSSHASHIDRRSRTAGSYNQAMDNPVPMPPPISLNTSQTRSHTDLASNQISTSPQRLDVLIPSATVAHTQDWLQRNRFGGYVKTFSSFSGSDLLTLSRDDITQICGHADGIRLYNALRSKTVHPKLTLYLTPAIQENDNISIYKAFYLERATVSELIKAASACLFEDYETTNRPRILRILYQPRCSSIHVLVTDEVVSQMKDESSFTVALIKNEGTDAYQVILKP